MMNSAQNTMPPRLICSVTGAWYAIGEYKGPQPEWHTEYIQADIADDLVAAAEDVLAAHAEYGATAMPSMIAAIDALGAALAKASG